MEIPNSSQPEVSKLTPNQMIFCPWISRAPLIPPTGQKNVLKAPEVQANCSSIPKSYINCQHSIMNQTCNVNQQMEANTKRSFPFSYSPIQQSSEQFFNFLRLMQLFPDVHPATLHTVLVLCKNQFFCAVDKLIYAKKCKEMYSNRSTCLQNCPAATPMKTNRHKPYACNRTNTCPNENFQNLGPLNSSTDFSSPKLPVCENQTSTKKNEDCSLNDLPPVASPKCQLPIRPLSPILSQTSQNLSNDMEESSLF